MATVGISGKNGSVAVTGGTGDVGSEIKNWDLSYELDLEDATSFNSSGAKEYVAGLTGATGSLTAVGSIPTLGSVTTLTLETGNTAGDLQITGAAFINAAAVTTPVDGIVEYSGSFTFTGAVTIGAVS
jgi:hypothetical protein